MIECKNTLRNEGNTIMKKFMEEFKKFISRGNVMDMAVGVIIGGAFTSIVNSLVNDVMMPVLSLITGGLDFSKLCIALGEGEGAATLNYGAFISAIINFIIMALVIFSLIKFLNKVSSLNKKPVEEKPAEPTTKVCPFCMSEIPLAATRCAHCTSMLEK